MSTLQSLDRALSILEVISQQETIGLTKLSLKTGLNKATTFRIVKALKDNGYVRQLSNKQYALTFKMFRLGNRVVQRVDFMSEAKRIITKLAHEVDQVIHLVIQDGTQILYVDKYTPLKNGEVMSETKIGKRAPMYCTASGKAILAYMSEDKIRQIWNETEIIKYTARTITNYDTLLQDLKRIRKNGYSTEYEEYQLEVYCIGMPIHTSSGEIVGAISISIPLNDPNGKQYYIEKMKKCKEEISTIIKE